jgi:hypothetical protein
MNLSAGFRIRKVALSSLTLASALVLGGGGLSPIPLAAAEPGKRQAPEGRSQLLGLPSAPKKHVETIKALADNTWLNLGSPVADPKWGKGRGRSWSSRMAYTPDLKAAFLFGEGVHCWWNRDNNRYMDDLFVYDTQSHRWLCAYPGTDVMKVDLKLDRNGFEVDQEGRPVPIAQLGHGYEMLTYDTDRKRFMFMPGASQDWQAGAPFGKKRLAWGVKGQGLPNRCSPWLYDVQSGRWDLRKVDGPAPARTAVPLGLTFVYVPSMKKAFFWNPTVQEAWFYDPDKNSWSNLKPRGLPLPVGIDKVACLDPKRQRIYLGGPKNLACYDLKGNAFIDLQPKGKPPQNVDDYLYGPFSTSRSVMNYDAASDVVVLFYHGNGPTEASRKGRGVYLYDPATNSWGKAPLPVPKEFCKCPSSFYDPVLNAHFIHCAADSNDDGVMLVYRYKAG